MKRNAAAMHVPFLQNGDMLWIYRVAHVLIGEPATTSPGHARMGSALRVIDL